MNRLRIRSIIIVGMLLLLLGIPSFAQDDSGIYISGYVEGSGYNKALEITNVSGAEIDLNDYTLEIYSNGKTTPKNIGVSGSVADRSVFVIIHTSTESEKLIELGDYTTGALNFNGDDVLVLKKDGTVIDRFGQVGNNQNFAKDVTFVRKNKEKSLTPEDAYNPEDYFDTFTKDSLEGLGVFETVLVPEPVVSVISIETARNKLENEEVEVKGTISYIDGTKNYYIQDDTAGILIYDSDSIASGLQIGQKIQVKGVRKEFHNLSEIVPTEITVMSSENEVLAREINASDISENLESQKVKLTNVRVDSVDKYKNYTTYDSEGNSFVIQDKKKLGIEVGKKYTFLEGTLTYNYGAYKVMVSNVEEEQVEPDQPGVYHVRVTKIVDGDTIHIEPDVLDAHKIRMLNMDTPETYHAINNENDRLQKLHGDWAKDGINELIKVGDEITMKLNPEEPTDQYGRLLAQIYTKDDLNVNLEMVRLGYAVSYFIWPISSEEDYRLYQAAVKEAKDNKLGIWQEGENALPELPFVFRAREQGKGLQRFVGNSDTKKYFYPENYEMVPVEKRIFFKPESQAQANGYTKEENQPIPEEPVFEKVTIAEARKREIGSKLMVEGIVSFIDGKNYYIQDQTASMVIRSDVLEAKIGDKIQSKAGTSEYYSFFQMVTDENEVLSSDHSVMSKTIQGTDFAEANEASFVNLKEIEIIGPDPDDQQDSRNKDKTYLAKDENGNTFAIRTKYQDPPEIGKKYAMIEGVITYSWNKYKLIPSRYVEELKSYTVSFDTAGGSPVESVEVVENEMISKPTDPTREGYTFKYWMVNGAEYDFAKPITQDITLVAKWEKKTEAVEKKYTVSFDTAGGSPVKSVEVVENEMLSKPTDPTREGYTFKYWMVNGAEYDFTKPITQDITLVAKWEKEEEIVLTNAPFGIKVTSDEGVLLPGWELRVSDVKKTYTGFDSVTYSIEVVDENGQVIENFDGMLRVSINIPEHLRDAEVVLYYNPEGDKLVEHAFIRKNDTISFMTDHFSKWVLAKKKVATAETKPSVKLPNTGERSTIYLVLGFFMIVVAGYWLVLFRRKYQ